MRTATLISAIACVLAASTVMGQEVEPAGWGRRVPPNCPPAPWGPVPVQPWMPGVPSTPLTPPSTTPPTTPQDPKSPTQQPTTDAFAQASEGGTMPSASAQPGFFGDFMGYSGVRALFVRGGNQTGQPPLIRVPLASRTGIKIVDGESPRPVDRVFYMYNYYSEVNRAINPAFVPTVGVHRHMVGFEKTGPQGDASVGIRLPFVQVDGIRGFESGAVGDMSIILKYAFLNDRNTGNVISGGLVLSVPTGNGIIVDVPNANGIIDGSVQQRFHPMIFQPWGGFIRNVTPRLYAHGFSSFAVPTDSRDVTIYWADLGAGYWLYKNPADRFIQGIVPTFEYHLNIPLTHRGVNNVPVGFADQLNCSGGMYIMFPRSTFGFAAGFPVLGPRPFGVEGIATYTLRF